MQNRLQKIGCHDEAPNLACGGRMSVSMLVPEVTVVEFRAWAVAKASGS